MGEYWGMVGKKRGDTGGVLYSSVLSSSFSESVWLRGSGLWMRLRGFRKEPRWNLDKLESRLRIALTSYGKSAKFPLVSLDSVGNLVISCWPPPYCCLLPTCKQSPIHKSCPALALCPMFQRVGLTKESRIPRIQDQLCSQGRRQHRRKVRSSGWKQGSDVFQLRGNLGRICEKADGESGRLKHKGCIQGRKRGEQAWKCVCV